MKNISFIPLSVPDFRGNSAAMVTKSIRENWVSSAGPKVDEFESLLAKEVKSKFVLATITGSTALHLALSVLGVGRGHKVLVPDFTFAATINSVIISGAEPILVDIDRDTWTLDLESTKTAILKFKPKAIIVVHTLGHPAKMDELKNLALENKIYLIEDAAGALGAEYKGRKVGTLADAGIYSFNGNKIFSTGSGGALVLKKQQFYKKAKSLYIQAKIRDQYNYSDVGFNYRMSNLNASLGVSQIPYLKKLILKKIEIAKKYDAAFNENQYFRLMPRKKWAKSSCWLYSLEFRSDYKAKNFFEYLLKNKISAKPFWKALSKQKPYKHYKKILNGNAAFLSNKIISIPCSTSLNKIQQNRVINTVNNWIKLNKKKK